MDLNSIIASFNKLTQLVGNDVKRIGEQIGQIVAKVTQIDQRLTRLEQQRGAPAQAMDGNHGNTQVVNGQVIPGPAVSPQVPDATAIWNGKPNAFYEGGED